MRNYKLLTEGNHVTRSLGNFDLLFAISHSGKVNESLKLIQKSQHSKTNTLSRLTAANKNARAYFHNPGVVASGNRKNNPQSVVVNAKIHMII